MKKFNLKVRQKKMLADTHTPVSLYLKVRDVYACSILLESSDYKAHENSVSLICCQPISRFEVRGQHSSIQWPDQTSEEKQVTTSDELTQVWTQFIQSFSINENTGFSGVFGYMSYDIVKLAHGIPVKGEAEVPDVLYHLYRFIIRIDHFSNELTLLELSLNEDDGELEKLQQLIQANRTATYQFKKLSEEKTNLTDETFLAMVEKGRAHCQRGDVFQIVLSRRFSTKFQGDEFNVYRALRSINPSPYLFYFDYGNFKLMGSSPEAQLKVSHGVAQILPIAGTYRRAGSDKEDAETAARLAADEKENAEHVMLVDLARNDLSQHAHHVKVEVFKDMQFYSHVIHLVSKVTGQLDNNSSLIKLALDTFPAGTLSGAPKHMAMNLINEIENCNRGFYAGAIGYIGFDGSFNHAIMIRTFLSKNNELIFQAGAGVVSKSKAENELQEVNNKLAALRKAVLMAENI